MSNKITRRDFLRMGAMGTAASVISGCTVNLQRTEYLESYVEPPEEGLPGDNLWYASTCRQCSAGCGVIVRVSGGRACKIEGNPLHPINQGKLCARGQAALQELYDPDRLRNAVRQPGGRGSQQFEPLYWDDALSLLVDRLRSVSPEGVAFLSGSPSTHQWAIISRFMVGLGGSAPIVYSLGDELDGRGPLASASDELFGTPALPFYDIANAEVIFSFSANFLETWLSPVHFSRAYARMRRGELGQRGYLVQFEPRLSSTAASADLWVPIHPGTEGLVALALGQLLVEQGLGVGAQADSLYADIDVAAAADASGVAVEELERLARVFGQVDHPLAIPGAGLAGAAASTTAVTAVQALNHVTGQLGRAGGVYLPPSSENDDFAPPPASAFSNIEGLIDDMAAGRVELLMIHGADPVFEIPAAAGFVEALRNVPYVVSFSPTVDDTAVQADLILPDHTSLEGWGYHVPPVADRVVVSGQQPVMRPLYDTRATVDVLLALAQELGGNLVESLPWSNETEFLREMTAAWMGDESPEAFWGEWRRRGGWWPEQVDLQAPATEATFPSPLIQPEPAPRPANDFPFQLHLYPSLALGAGRGANKAWLQELPDPMTTVAWQTWVEVNPHTALELGVEDGDIVKVISSAGEVEAIVYVFPGIGEDTVALPVGRGHQHYGRYAKAHGANVAALLPSQADPETGSLIWGTTRVRVEPTGQRASLARLESAEGIAYLQGEH